jgi:hypothetical protein
LIDATITLSADMMATQYCKLKQKSIKRLQRNNNPLSELIKKLEEFKEDKRLLVRQEATIAESTPQYSIS